VPGRVPGRLRRIMRAATRFGSYRVESEGVLRGHEKPNYTTRPDSLSAKQYLSKLFRGGVEKYASQNTQDRAANMGILLTIQFRVRNCSVLELLELLCWELFYFVLFRCSAKKTYSIFIVPNQCHHSVHETMFFD
jgi:hypothetical protein